MAEILKLNAYIYKGEHKRKYICCLKSHDMAKNVEVFIWLIC